MLTPEQAKAELETHRDRADERRRLVAIAALDEPARAIAYALLGREADGTEARRVVHADYVMHASMARQEWAAPRLDALTPEARLPILRAFFPVEAEAVERGWQLQRTQPYAVSYAQVSPFRAPQRPDLSLAHRQAWLLALASHVGAYHEDVFWLARHAAYLHDYYGQTLGLLFAAVIDGDPARGPALFDLLVAAARGEDAVAGYGRYIPVALLAAARPEGWECVERVLLGAQREEGVRQTILEALATAHPAAFARMLGVIGEQQLTRFSAVTRAVNGWLGTTWDSAQAPAVARTLEALRQHITAPDRRASALAYGTSEEAYLALWATACDDVTSALPLAERLLQDGDAARRYAATRLLAGSLLREAIPALARALTDSDPRVAAQACAGLQHLAYPAARAGRIDELADGPLFEQIEDALPGLPARAQEMPPLLWNVPVPPATRASAADLLLTFLGARDPKRLIPHLSAMNSAGRVNAAKRLAEGGLGDATVRQVLLDMARDRSHWVSAEALKLLAAAPVDDLDDATLAALEGLLARKLDALRRGVLALLLRLPDAQALPSAERLLGSSQAAQRLGGLELVRLLHEARRSPEGCVALATAYRASHPRPPADEQALLDAVLSDTRAVPTLDDALGLVRAADLTPLAPPRPRDLAWTSPAAVAALRALDELVHAHRDVPYRTAGYRGEQEHLLGGNGWQFPAPSPQRTPEEDVARLPLADLWRGWYTERAPELRDADGLELPRMLIQLQRRGDDVTRMILARLGVPAESAGEATDAPRLSLRYPNVLERLCWWLMRLAPAAGVADFLLDHMEDELTRIPERELRDPEDGTQRYHYRAYQKLQHAVTLARTYHALCPAGWSDAQVGRLFHLLRWSVSLPQEHLRYSPTIAEALVAHRAGQANEADLLYHFLGPRAHTRQYGLPTFDDLRAFSSRQSHPLLAEFPIAGALYARALERVLAVELERGQMPTAATPAALSLRSLSGAATFVRVLRALGDELFTRGHSYHDDGRAHTLSHLLRITVPAASDTPEALGALLRAARVGERRTVEVALYAPQWAALLEGVLGWPGFAEAVWWVHAHTKDSHWSVEQAIRDGWAAAIAEWTPLTADDLAHGAVDVNWFHRAFGRLGEVRWQQIYRAAKYTSGGAGHARAQLFADAMLGRVEEAALLTRLRTKRHRDSACALGLLPLPAAPATREPAVLARYQALQAFIRGAKAFGAQRREGDTRAAHIGIANLARTAGYADPARFQWTMELRESDDLAAGPLTLTRDAVTFTLRIDALGVPHLGVEKAGRTLKDVPAALKKDPGVVALRERKRQLEHQAARMRAALEQAMVREEAFTAGELARLIGHPLLAPLLSQLVFVTPEGLSYVAGAGQALLALTTGATLLPQSTLRIAHPHDLLASGAWSAWQRECFVAERIQPFKQVFRELYPLTVAERDGDAISRRYAGQQIQPQQAMALLAARGWITSAEDGQATRTYHERGITVAVEFLFGGGTAADVEGLTIEGVTFGRAGASWGKPLPLAEVPPVLFSEAMRDLDLVVSVAHRGGVDPEGSASTVEMRAALVREVAASLALTNVRIQSAHGVVTGTLGEYSVHLGSGMVQRLPGGSICIIPVHAQHRGRVFLPFADDDPKTAEIVSKVLLLARDAEIKDPLILQQLYARV